VAAHDFFVDATKTENGVDMNTMLMVLLAMMLSLYIVLADVQKILKYHHKCCRHVRVI
jgi:hypothetical protein